MSGIDRIILESMAKAKGVTVEQLQIQISNKGKKKKKEEVVRVINVNPTLEIINDKSKTIDFSDIKGSIKKSSLKDNVFNWGPRDVGMYIAGKFRKKYNKDWGHNLIGTSSEITRIHDRIIDIYGHCDYLVMRDYVDYIFSRQLDEILASRKGIFHLTDFRKDRYIQLFASVYNYKESFEKERNKQDNKQKEIEACSFRAEDVEQIYLLSEEEFIISYGVVICAYWLHKYYNHSKEEAVNKVYDICYSINKKGNFEEVRKITEKFSPYPEEFLLGDIFKNNESLKINIKYSKDETVKNKFKFFKENK